jgi:MT0933-like antitoxin protein
MRTGFTLKPAERNGSTEGREVRVSVFDSIKGKAADLIGGNQEAIKNGITKAGEFVDSKTGEKFKGQIDGVQNAASGFVSNLGGKKDGPAA